MPVPGYVEFSGGPTPFRYIEWLEIKKVASKHIGMLVSDCLADRSCEIQNVIGQMNLNYEENDLSFVIYGYRRASQTRQCKGRRFATPLIFNVRFSQEEAWTTHRNPQPLALALWHYGPSYL
jgi:hypothetical protein